MTEESRMLDLPQEQYEPVLSQPVDMDMLETEITICALDITEDHVFQTCYGDICKTVNALRDYSRILEMACETWTLQGYHRALYELHAQKLREIADKLQAGIGYDYDAAVEKCKKRAARKHREDDSGGEALAMAYIKSRQAAAAKKRKAAEERAGATPSELEESDIGFPDGADMDGVEMNDSGTDDPWDEDL